MTNEIKLLRAFIEAQGYEIEEEVETEVFIQKGTKGSFLYNGTPEVVTEVTTTDYKVTKKGNTLIFSDKQLEKLSDVLDNTTDCGPYHSGWNSPELDELIEIVNNEKV